MTEKEIKAKFDLYKVTDDDYVKSPYSEDNGEMMLMFNEEYGAEEQYFRFFKAGYMAAMGGNDPDKECLDDEEVDVDLDM